MCKYCDAKNDDSSTSDVFCEEVDFGVLGKKEISINIWQEEDKTFTLNIDAPFLDNCFFIKKINYCPMCGRKLGEQNNG